MNLQGNNDMKKIIRKSFKRELFLGLFLVSLIPGIVISLLLVKVFKSRLASDYQAASATQVASVTEALEQYFNLIDETQLAIISNKKIVGGISETDSWQKNKAYTALYDATENARNVARFNIYDIEGNLVFTTSTEGYSESIPTYWGILKVSFAHPDERIIKKAVMSDDEKVVIQIARAIVSGDECVGFVVTDIFSSHIEEILAKTYDESYGIAILDSFYEDVYSTRTGKEEALAALIRQRQFDGEPLKQENDEVEFFLSRIGDTNLTLVLGKEPVLTDDITRTMWGVTTVIILFSVILCFFVANIISDYLTSPIIKLSKAMEKVKGGDLNVSVHSSRIDELGQLSEDFDKMTDELKTYMELQVKQQQEINDSNIAMMQAQLNPHFLYNTLDTMKWVAKANNVPDLAKMSADLAQILRLSISDRKFITLAEEMEMVEKYVEIQQIRFGGNFTFDAELPMELEDCVIPKLIIQPIVENALIHGLKEQEKGHIFVNAYSESDNLKIEVTDNGCGIEGEILEKLNSRDREKLKGHIGFYNVDTILRLYYGDNFGLKACKPDEGGTKVLITLPLTKERNNDQSPRC